MTNEIEIKFKLDRVDNTRAKLLNIGGVPKKPYKQTTYGFFSKDSIEKGVFPRIRNEHGKTVFTVKVKTRKKTKYFERKEYSVEIASTEDGINIIKSMGYNQVRTFKKIREEWEFKDIKVVLDKLYFGTYMEIEGSKDGIERMVKKLGFKNKERIIKAYLGLEDDYLELKNKINQK